MKLFNKKNSQKTFKLNLQKAFELNLKYISSTEKNVFDIKNQFKETDTRTHLIIGKIDCPTGKLVVSDPLAYLGTGKFSPTLEIEIPTGEYPIEIAILKNNDIGIRVCTAKLIIKNSEVVKYVLATSTEESASFKGKEGILSGFPVDAGMISICDEQVAKEYQSFLNNWYNNNPKGNHYDDYFAKFFAESESKLPQFQREGGDFIEWVNPNTKNRLVMIASGLGDGYYQSYWGYDSTNEICELIIPLVNPDLFE